MERVTPPTVRQIYGLARALCAEQDIEFPETRELAPDTTMVELPLGEHPLRVHVLGHNRGGRLLGRAIVSGLTREGWRDKWERRASSP